MGTEKFCRYCGKPLSPGIDICAACGGNNGAGPPAADGTKNDRPAAQAGAMPGLPAQGGGQHNAPAKAKGRLSFFNPALAALAAFGICLNIVFVAAGGYHFGAGRQVDWLQGRTVDEVLLDDPDWYSSHLRITGGAYSDSYAVGQIVQQSIGRDRILYDRQRLEITVSLGPDRVTVQDYTGFQAQQVADMLAAQQIDVVQQQQVDARSAPGTVLAQDLAPDTQVCGNTVLTLTVAAAPEAPAATATPAPSATPRPTATKKPAAGTGSTSNAGAGGSAGGTSNNTGSTGGSSNNTESTNGTANTETPSPEQPAASDTAPTSVPTPAAPSTAAPSTAPPSTAPPSIAVATTAPAPDLLGGALAGVGKPDSAPAIDGETGGETATTDGGGQSSPENQNGGAAEPAPPQENVAAAPARQAQNAAPLPATLPQVQALAAGASGPSLQALNTAKKCPALSELADKDIAQVKAYLWQTDGWQLIVDGYQADPVVPAGQVAAVVGSDADGILHIRLSCGPVQRIRVPNILAMEQGAARDMLESAGFAADRIRFLTPSEDGWEEMDTALPAPTWAALFGKNRVCAVSADMGSYADAAELLTIYMSRN